MPLELLATWFKLVRHQLYDHLDKVRSCWYCSRLWGVVKHEWSDLAEVLIKVFFGGLKPRPVSRADMA